MSSLQPPPRFLFITCQVGAEAAVKGELARRWPDFRIGYARPGFLTFKLPEENTWPPISAWNSVFARAYGFSLGNASLADEAGHADNGSAAQQVWKLLGDRPIARSPCLGARPLGAGRVGL